MNRRHAAAAALLASAAAFLATACGSNAAANGAARSTVVAVEGSAAPVPSSRTGTPDGTSGTGAAAGKEPAAAPAPATENPATAGTAVPDSKNAPQPAGGAGTNSGRKPCALPAGFDHFFKLDSAETYQGRTVVRATPETCSVDKGNDEDVSYTPIHAAQSFTVNSAASVKVLDDYSTTPHAVSPSWLVSHHLGGNAQFYYKVDGQNRITAMEQIYHP
jgi:hypothetical protein